MRLQLLNLALLPISLAVSHSALAQKKSGALPFGEYITRGGHGVLEIKPVQASIPQSFEISTVGANGHICDVKGKIRNRQSRVSTHEDGSEICHIKFHQESNGAITVDAEPNQACRNFCGMRAFFADTYLIPADGCSIDQLTTLNERAKSALKENQHAQTREITSQVLAQCEATLRWESSLELRLLLTHASVELGDSEKCREAMGEVIHAALVDPVAIEMPLPPAEHYFFTKLLEDIRPAAVRCGVISH